MKRVKVLRIAIFALLGSIMVFSATGCRDAQSPQSKAMAEWVGASTKAVIAGWGAPNKIYTNGSGGHVLCYLNYKPFVHINDIYTEQGNSSTSDVYTDVNINDAKLFEQADIDQYRYYRIFMTEADGTVYDWLWRGE